MAAKRGRTAGFRMGDDHRVKIANSNILKCLIDHAQGKREMNATQVTAGIALLKKVLPDLQSMTLKGDEDAPLTFTEVKRMIIDPAVNGTQPEFDTDTEPRPNGIAHK